jgi:excisionase family DNA binding protein
MSRVGVLSNAVRVEPGETDRDATALIALATAGPRGQSLTLQLSDGTLLPLSAALVTVLRASADQLAEGHAVTVLPSEVSLTPAEAAELLGLSRPFVVRLLDQGDIPSERLPRSRHRRVLLSDVLAFTAKRDRRRTGRHRLAEIVEGSGLPY